MDEWGSIDTNFVTLASVKILPLKFIGFSYGLVDVQGSIYVLNNAKGIEYIPELENGLYYHNVHEEMVGVINNDILRLTVKGKANTIPTSEMPFTGLYNQWGEGENYVDPEDLTAAEKEAELDGDIILFKAHTTFAAGLIDVAVIAESKVYGTLDSLLTVGPFRLSSEQVNDNYSYINNLILGMKEEGVGEISIDWNSNLQFPTEIVEDWNLLDGEEDWGDAPAGSVQFALSVIPTKDAYTPIEDDTTTVGLVAYDGVNLIYSCYSNGIYHLITLDATEVDDNFYLKTIDANINLGGRML